MIPIDDEFIPPSWEQWEAVREEIQQGFQAFCEEAARRWLLDWLAYLENPPQLTWRGFQGLIQDGGEKED